MDLLLLLIGLALLLGGGDALVRGASALAHRLGISSRTVKAHLTSVYNKLGVDSRAAAIAVAAQKGLLS